MLLSESQVFFFLTLLFFLFPFPPPFPFFFCGEATSYEKGIVVESGWRSRGEEMRRADNSRMQGLSVCNEEPELHRQSDSE